MLFFFLYIFFFWGRATPKHLNKQIPNTSPRYNLIKSLFFAYFSSFSVPHFIAPRCVTKKTTDYELGLVLVLLLLLLHTCSEVTEGALQVWRTLPERIRQDPSLASFRQEHERLHGGK